MLANHETGVLQPIEQLAAICREAGVPMHCDAVAAAGKVPIDFRRLGVDALSVAAHKFQGPLGIVRYCCGRIEPSRRCSSADISNKA